MDSVLASIGHRGPAQGMINASVQDIVRILETTRKKSRWESFGEFRITVLGRLGRLEGVLCSGLGVKFRAGRGWLPASPYILGTGVGYPRQHTGGRVGYGMV